MERVTKIVETHYVRNPVISIIDNETERDIVPLVKRVKYVKILFLWCPVKKQIIRKCLNEWIQSVTIGTKLDYSHVWDKELQSADIVRYE